MTAKEKNAIRAKKAREESTEKHEVEELKLKNLNDPHVSMCSTIDIQLTPCSPSRNVSPTMSGEGNKLCMTAKEKNAIRAKKAREEYHSLSEEERKRRNKKRSVNWAKQKEREGDMLRKLVHQATAEDLERVEKILAEKRRNKKRSVNWAKQKEREGDMLRKLVQQATAEDLERVEKILVEKVRRAEVQRRRYHRKSFEERRASNHENYLKRKERQEAALKPIRM
uniref:SURF6 domain-containing protein n=1 Tax=Steinernema glaseri TaxID=37863 RepID=A0A1I7Z518_9BILA